MTKIFSFVCVLGAALLAGCGDTGAAAGPSGGPAIAVLDLRAVAKRLGDDEAVRGKVEARRKQLLEQAVKMRQSAIARYENKKKAFGPKPTAAQEQELKTLFGQIQAALGKADAQMKQSLLAYNAELDKAFKAELKPVAEAIAHRRGFTSVMYARPDVFLVIDPKAEITEAVADELLEKRLKGSAPAPSP